MNISLKDTIQPLMGQKSGYRNSCERTDRKYHTVKQPGILGSMFRSPVPIHSEFKPSLPKSPKDRDAFECHVGYRSTGRGKDTASRKGTASLMEL